MTPAQFFAAALPFAEQAHAATGVDVSVVLAQWAEENGYIWPPPGNNPGNVGNTQHGGQVNYATPEAGVAAYIQTMFLGYYDAVRTAPTPFLQARALGASPWAAGHYGSPPGANLWALIQRYGLTQYDGNPVTPGPPQQEAPPMIAPTPSGNGYWIVNAAGAVYTFGDAEYLGGPNTSNTAPAGQPPKWTGAPNLPAGETCVSIAAHPSAQGYWVESSAGDVYSYGAAGWHGNLPT